MGRCKARLQLLLYRIVMAVSFPFWIAGRVFARCLGRRAVFSVAERCGSGLQVSPHAVWILAVSGGEAAGAVVLVRELEQAGKQAIVSTVTAAGAAVLRQAGICPLPEPLDLAPVVSRWLQRVQPAMIVLYEMELWPELLAGASRNQIPVALVNGRMPVRELRRYRVFRALIARLTADIRFAAVRSQAEAARFLGVGFPGERIVCTGDIKFDQNPLRAAGNPGGGFFDVALLSVHRSEERVMLRTLQLLSGTVSGLRILYAPRRIAETARLERALTARGWACRRRTDGDCGAPEHFFSHYNKDAGNSVLLLDSFGELAGWCAHAKTALLGGSFDRRIGGHNPMEAAQAAVPLVFGPCMENFLPQRELLLEGGGGVEVQGADGAARQLCRWLQNEAERIRAGSAAAAAAESGRGAAARCVGLILENLT